MVPMYIIFVELETLENIKEKGVCWRSLNPFFFLHFFAQNEVWDDWKKSAEI